MMNEDSLKKLLKMI